VSDQVFIAQLTAAWRDGSPDAVKVGMLGDAARAEQFAEVIESTAGSGIRGFVIDPVLAAGVDDQSLASSALPPAIVRLAVRLARSHLVVLTPNVPELSALLRAPPARDFPELVSGAQALHRLTGAAVLATGGHLKEDTGTDVLVSDAETSRFESAVWPAADDVHGTGCCLSTAIAARLACGDTLKDSVRVGRGALLDKVENAVRIGSGRRQVGPSTEPR
jgi:hydroxymethylpyrimidine/phosphomethylpyrimidine kinase